MCEYSIDDLFDKNQESEIGGENFLDELISLLKNTILVILTFSV